jgi:hypothetical protein
LITRISPALISSYSFERPMPVSRHASGMRTVRAAGGLSTLGLFGEGAADTCLL